MFALAPSLMVSTRARFFRGRQADEERGPISGPAFHPDAAAVRRHDFAANGKTNARSFEFLERMKPPEKLKDRLVEPRVDADTIVSHEEGLVGISFARRRLPRRVFHGSNLHEGCRALIVFHSVAHKVRQK